MTDAKDLDTSERQRLRDFVANRKRNERATVTIHPGDTRQQRIDGGTISQREMLAERARVEKIMQNAEKDKS